MDGKRWNGWFRFLNKLCIVVFLMLLSFQQAFAGGAGPNDFYIDDTINILPNNLLQSTFRRPYSFRIAYRDGGYYEEVNATNINLQEWSVYLQTDIDTAKAYVYKKEGIETLAVDVQTYLEFVHKNQSLTDQGNHYERIQKMRIDPKGLQHQYLQQINEAEQLMSQTNSPVLQMRWLFIMLRLAHYSEQFSVEIGLYRKYGPKLRKNEATSNSEIWYWIDSLLAGRLKRIAKEPKDKARAAYEFAKIFHYSTSKKIEAFHNFSITTDEEWSYLQDFCKDNDEKAMMYFIRALQPGANTLVELESILDVAPNSIWAHELLAWELELAQPSLDLFVPESQAYQQEHISKVMLQNRSEYVQEHATKFHRILKDVIKKELMTDLFLPRFAEIYISLLQNNPVSMKDFRDFESMYKDDSRIQYVKGLELLVYLYNVKNIDESKEKQIDVYLQWFENIKEIEMHHIYPIVFLALEPLYVVSKESAKLNFVHDQGYVNLDRLKLKDVNDLLHIMDQNQNPLWKRFLPDTHNKQKYQLTKVMKLIEEQHYQEALEIVQGLDGANRVYTTYDPFASLMRADNLVMTESKMYLEDFVKKLVALQKSIDINKKNSQAYFSIGNAIYNTTWFGNSSTLIRHSKTNVSWNQGITDMSMAKKYYTKALDYATSDEERAQIIYALAKVELVEVSVVLAEKEGHPGYWEAPYYMRKKENKSHTEKLQEYGFGIYFRKAQSYDHTEYYKNVIQKCTLFQAEKW